MTDWVIVVDDDKSVLRVACQVLRKAGIRPTAMRSGREALDFIKRNGYPDLILLDVNMPETDGFETLRLLKREMDMDPENEIPIVLMTGEEDQEAKGLEAGADDYLVKPFSIIELVARVQALLRRASRNEEPTMLAVDDLEMDLVAHRVTRGGVRINLQPLEYQLLEYLMRNRGRVVSRATILERVWDYDFDPHTNVVDSRVCHLRDKIDRGADCKLIKTVRGVGYVLG